MAKGATWRVYRGDTYPQVLSLRGMVEKLFMSPFVSIQLLWTDLQSKGCGDVHLHRAELRCPE